MRAAYGTETDLKTLCDLVCFHITGEPNARYVWGFERDMRRDSSKVAAYIDWIVKDFEHNKSSTNSGFNFSHMQQHEFLGSHRSGWSFVMTHLRQMHVDRGVIFDTCIDRTFHWSCDVLQKAGVIPYSQTWVGVLHHTPLESYTRYNATALVQNPLFLASLMTCRGIYVLSETLARWLRRSLSEYPSVLIQVIMHPTAIEGTRKWSPAEFQSNSDKMLVQVGSWLRDTFAIYELAAMDDAASLVYSSFNVSDKRGGCFSTPRTDTHRHAGVIFDGKRGYILQKAVLRGKEANHYLKPCDVLICDASQHAIPTRPCCPETNKWVVGLQQYMSRVCSHVLTVEGVSDTEYDSILAKNIVFLRLYDASACNTVIECIVRATPLLINRLPAVVEALGPDYPLYYDTLAEALDKSRSFAMVAAAHDYLLRLCLENYHVEALVKSIRNGPIYLSCLL